MERDKREYDPVAADLRSGLAAFWGHHLDRLEEHLDVFFADLVSLREDNQER